MAGKKATSNSGRKILRQKRGVCKVTEVEISPKSSVCSKHVFTPEETSFLQSHLLKWYDAHQRKLPWRDIAKFEKDADKRGYAVWVSEVMLQQTQVATVIPYYNKWMKKWPTVNDLAGATLEEVNQVWSGLGYYSRARRLHEGAKLISLSRQGHIPEDVDDLKNGIPGIGKYTACAISSVAYQQAVGVVDGNVSRVLARLRAIGSDVSKPFAQNHLWQLADTVVSRSRPGDFNQALMEFGAVMCTPRNAKCSECPLSSICMARSMVEKSCQKLTFQRNNKGQDASVEHDIENVPDCQHCVPAATWKSSPDVTIFPIKPQKKSSRVERVAVVVVEKDNCLLTVRRPDSGLLAGLWEFPSIILAEGKNQQEFVSRWLSDYGISENISSGRTSVGEVLHIFSHIRTTYAVEYLKVDSSFDAVNDHPTRWLSREEFASAAVSTAMKKVLKIVDENQKTDITKKDTGRKRKRESADAKKQPSITSFFTK